jgi:MoaA/NifB/PqqE/SkfB family radical SAM enzyme
MRDRERLWNYYAAGRLHLPRPRYLCFNATLRCDGRCGHCGIWRTPPPPRELSADELASVLARPLFQRVQTAWLTGGEPTLRDDAGALARAMVRTLPALTTLGIATNGLDPARVLDRATAMAEALGEPQGLFVHLSLDGVGEVHDRLRGRTGAFAAVAETIARLRELKRTRPRLELGLNCVIQPGNVAHLDELNAYAREQGLPLMFNIALVTDQVYRNQDREQALTLSPAEREKVAAFLRGLLPASPPAFRYQYHIILAVLAGQARPRRCLTLYTTININADGSLIPCPAASDLLPLNVLTDNPERIWRGAAARAMRRRVHRELCPGCMLSCSLGDSMPLDEWRRGGWDGRPK